MENGITNYTILPLIVLQNRNRIWIEGHIVKINNKLLVVKDKEKYWRNIIRVINSYIPGTIHQRRLEIHFNDRIYEVNTNKQGQLKIEIPVAPGKKIDPNDFAFYLKKDNGKFRIQIPEPYSHYFYNLNSTRCSVISDIDDTILVTHTRNIFKKLRTLLVKNAYKRKAVREMRDLYQHFAQKGNAFFYVSNSEANLFPMIRIFLEHQGLPIGPIFLRSFKKWKNLLNKKSRKKENNHKMNKIKLLLELFPDMKFILIGDDSQKDPEIYGYFALNYPERIERIMIRQVKKEKIKRERIQHQKTIMDKQKIEFTYFKRPAELLNKIR